jgi:hypothetical protein
MSNRKAPNESARNEHGSPPIGHNRPRFEEIVQDNLASGLHLAQRDILLRAIHDPRLEHRHRIVLASIIEVTNDETGMAFPGYAWLAKHTGYTQPTIYATTSQLAAFGYLVRTKRAATPGGRALAHYAIVRPTKDELQEAITAHIMQIRKDAAKAQLQHEGWRPDFNPVVKDRNGADLNPVIKDREADLNPVDKVMTLTTGLRTGADLNPVVEDRGADLNPVVQTVYIDKNNINNGHDRLTLGDKPIDGATDHNPKSSRGTRLDPEWVLPDEWRQWPKGLFQFSDLHVDKVAREFREYWVGCSRPKPKNIEWPDVWRNWCFFEEFWRSYPRKVDKGDVRDIFIDIIAGKHKTRGKADPQTIIDGAKQYAKHCTDQRVDSKYVKMPATWLNKGCWQDYSDDKDRHQRPAYDPIELDGDGDLLGGNQ